MYNIQSLTNHTTTILYCSTCISVIHKVSLIVTTATITNTVSNNNSYTRVDRTTYMEK